MVGVPVIINHKDLTAKNADDLRVGVVNSVWYDKNDGWYWCDGIIWDETAQNLITDKNWSVSCSYDVKLADDKGGSENNIKYDMEFLDGVFTHLALVSNPRYERANIVFNSKTEILNDKWVTVHPNGEDEEGRPLLIKDGESLKEAMQRQWGLYEKRQAKLKSDTKDGGEYSEDFKKLADETVELERNYLENPSSELAKQINKNRNKLLSNKKYAKLVYDKNIAKSDTKDGREERKSTFKPVKGIMQSLKDDYEAGKISAKEVAKELSKANLTPYLLDDNEALEKIGVKQSDSKGEKKEEIKTDEDKSIDKYLTDKSDKGWLYETKGTSTYSNNGKSAEVEEFGKDGGKYRVVFYDGNKRKDIKAYSTKRGMEKAVREHLSGEANKETKALETKTDLEAAKTRYKDVLSKYNEADRTRWKSGLTNEEYHKAWVDAEKYKKELTTARREYAESIMANFETVESNPYEEKQAARRERYEELSDKAQKSSDSYAKTGKEMFDVIPFGQPIHGQRDRNYRDNAWGKFEKSWKEQEKANYYADKAASVGKAGISADDANAIAKLAQKYKSGVTSAEKRRIIDRVIDIHKGMQAAGDTSKQTDYSELGFQVERNTDINRLQLKFDGKPDENTRSILKSNGFRWSPREMAWQRQLGGNSESGLNRVIEGLKKVNNSLLVGLDEIFSNLDIQTEQDANLYEEINNLLVSNSINNEKEQDMALLEELKNLIARVQNNKGAEMTSKERILSILNAADVDEDVKKEVENEIEEIEKEKLEDEEEIENKKKVKNEKVDKRDIIRQIMAIAGKNEDNEEVRTIAKLAEKLAYDESEAGTADNKKIKNEDEEDKKEVKEVKEDVKKDVENKCKNSVDNSKVDYFEKMNEIYNSVQKAKEENLYISQAEREKAAEEYFKK
jgi:hypothetical protein